MVNITTLYFILDLYLIHFWYVGFGLQFTGTLDLNIDIKCYWSLFPFMYIYIYIYFLPTSMYINVFICSASYCSCMSISISLYWNCVCSQITCMCTHTRVERLDKYISYRRLFFLVDFCHFILLQLLAITGCWVDGGQLENVNVLPNPKIYLAS